MIRYHKFSITNTDTRMKITMENLLNLRHNEAFGKDCLSADMALEFATIEGFGVAVSCSNSWPDIVGSI